MTLRMQEGGAAAAARGGDAGRRPRRGRGGGRRRAAGLLPGPLLPGARRRAVLQVGRPAQLITTLLAQHPPDIYPQFATLICLQQKTVYLVRMKIL